MSLRVAVTGNMGSGKTTVCQLFSQLGVPVFYADAIAKTLYCRPEVKSLLVNRLGDEIYDEKGTLVSSQLASVLFSDSEALAFVESVIHPLVHEAYHSWHQQNNKSAYTIYEAAIIFEKSRSKDFDKIIYVAANESLRLERLLQRDKSAVTDLKKRMRLQWPDEEKTILSHFVVNNDGQHALPEQVVKIHKAILLL